MTRIVLDEHSDARLDLTPEDLALLHGRLGTWFTVRPSLDGSAYLVNPGSTVGVVRLPSGNQLEIRPKVPLRNLLWMLSYAYEIPYEALDDKVTIARFDEVIEIIADAFSRMVEHRIDLGLYRNYIEEEANLPVVRGRILVAVDIHHNALLRHRTYCQYSTYSWDLAENQIIRHVVHMLSGWGFSRRLTGRLLTLDSQLDEVERVPFQAADVDWFVYNRQSLDYEPIHRLCRFFLEGTSLSEEAGSIAFDGFLIDMNLLFERLITRALRERLAATFALWDQVRTTLDVAGLVRIRPDLVVARRSRAMLVADCKYKRLTTGEHRHHDLYQLIAYCTAMELGAGVLIYPRHLVDIDTELQVRGAGGIRMREYAVDLGGTPHEVTVQFEILARKICTWAGASPGLFESRFAAP